jgi:hypothetical protein
MHRYISESPNNALLVLAVVAILKASNVKVSINNFESLPHEVERNAGKYTLDDESASRRQNGERREVSNLPICANSAGIKYKVNCP